MDRITPKDWTEAAAMAAGAEEVFTVENRLAWADRPHFAMWLFCEDEVTRIQIAREGKGS